MSSPIDGQALWSSGGHVTTCSEYDDLGDATAAATTTDEPLYPLDGPVGTAISPRCSLASEQKMAKWND